LSRIIATESAIATMTSSSQAPSGPGFMLIDRLRSSASAAAYPDAGRRR
jgi:hypothetical protein